MDAIPEYLIHIAAWATAAIAWTVLVALVAWGWTVIQMAKRHERRMRRILFHILKEVEKGEDARTEVDTDALRERIRTMPWSRVQAEIQITGLRIHHLTGQMKSVRYERDHYGNTLREIQRRMLEEATQGRTRRMTH